jgi:hypothetical protein
VGAESLTVEQGEVGCCGWAADVGDPMGLKVSCGAPGVSTPAFGRKVVAAGFGEGNRGMNGAVMSVVG